MTLKTLARLASDFAYSSHGIASNDWTLENGYKTNRPEAYPRRVFGSGERAGIIILLQFSTPDLEFLCRAPFQGFKITFHTPGEMPRVSKQYFRIQTKQQVLVNVKPNMMTTSEYLASYSPKRRHCYFNNERSLQFFKVYTQNNCELECLANFTLKECGCVKFSMPRTNSTKICGQKDVTCFDEAEDNLILQEVDTSLSSNSDGEIKTLCDCLPACTSISYDVELSQGLFSLDYFAALGASNDTKLFENKEWALLTILFKESQFIAFKRSEIYGWSEFIANCGGLFGMRTIFFFTKA